MSYSERCDAVRALWRRIKEPVLSGKGTVLQRFLYRALADFVTRHKHVLATGDLQARALWLMYHPEAGVLPCEGWRMPNPPDISSAELADLQVRYAADRAAVARRLGLDSVDLSTVTPSRRPRRIAVHVHDFHHDVLPRIEAALRNVPLPFDLFVSTPDPNRGRDIAPLICRFGADLLKYDYVAHFHTKKSPHVAGQGDWLGHILDELLGSLDDVARIFALLEGGYGFVAPSDFLSVPEDPTGWMRNLDVAERILRRSSLTLDLRRDFTPIPFPQGSMFWARTDFLRPFFTLPLTFDDFPAEPIGIDGSTAHALERMFFLWGRGTGLRIASLTGRSPVP